MKKKDLEEFKKILLKKKEKLVRQVEKFAKKEKGREDWTTQFPKFDGETGLEKAADEVEEYVSLLSLEYNIETQLKEINRALEKIEKGTFGICEKCKGEIEIERLKANPLTAFCQKCSQSQKSG
ncbi:TraR/DksA C4-type zinc finger protein [Candidatus Parcubacteria bacterium]|nr:TraR/DksA C4-type zinc finger protein [Candidatus Parcubacteria bacterium]